MAEIQSRLKGVADREKWAARGVTFVAKAKATKMVWFPPKPVDTGKAAASTATKATRRAGKKSTDAAKKSTRAAKKSTGTAAKNSTAAARKATSSTTKVVKPVRRNKT